MDLFMYIIIMLLAVLCSTVVNKFLPLIPTSVIQIVLGAMILLLPVNYTMTIQPNLFFILFVAPLVYASGMTINKQVIWNLKKPILNMAIVLVFLTCITLGSIIHYLIPTISLAAAITLTASFGPTDDVAVDSVSKRYVMPGKLMELLKGESVFNDVSSLILFQIGLAVVITGSFSPMQSIITFLISSFGGILVGMISGLFKSLLTKLLRQQEITNSTIHILLDLIAPFIIYNHYLQSCAE